MATGDEQNQSLQADAATYTLTIQGRAAGGQTPEVIGSYVTSKKADVVTAARRTTLSAADATAGLNAAGYTGSLIDVGNSLHVGLSARFSAASLSCTVFLALYDEAGGFIGVTRDYNLQGDATYTDGTLYPSVVEVIDTLCAAKVYPVLRVAPASGNVNLYLELL